jgi:hypothetical protein
MSWISVEDRLPKPYDVHGYSPRVLVCAERRSGKPQRVFRHIKMARYNGDKWVADNFNKLHGTVTHWQPLPEPPPSA